MEIAPIGIFNRDVNLVLSSSEGCDRGEWVSEVKGTIFSNNVLPMTGIRIARVPLIDLPAQWRVNRLHRGLHAVFEGALALFECVCRRRGYPLPVRPPAERSGIRNRFT